MRAPEALIEMLKQDLAIDTSQLPTDGPLVPVPDGWRLERIEDTRGFGSPILAMAAFISTTILHLWRPYCAAALAALIALRIGIVMRKRVGIVAQGARDRLRAQFVRRLGQGASVMGDPAPRICIEGRVATSDGFRTAVTGRTATLAKYLCAPPKPRFAWMRDRRREFHCPCVLETRGVDFTVLTKEELEVHVRVRHARLVDHPTGCFEEGCPDNPLPPAEEGRWYAETAIGPGDVVRVVGRARREVRPAAFDPQGGGTKTVLVFEGTADDQVLVLPLRRPKAT